MAKTKNVGALTPEQPNVGLDDDKRTGVVDTLNVLLADEFVLYTKTRNYHWNVMGPRFHDLHLFFEKQFGELEELMDDTAENVRQFGGFASGTMAEYVETSRLKESPGKHPRRRRDDFRSAGGSRDNHSCPPQGYREGRQKV